MKKFIQLCLWLSVTHLLGAQTIIYVRFNATGMNTGTTWDNAFTSLDAALAASNPGNQIWIGEGTYKPSTPAPNHSFVIQAGVEVYGGFKGNEASLSLRNIATAPTILSGDILGNDIAGNFITNRTDNSIHVVRTQNGNAANRAILDGVTVKGGITSLVAADPAANRQGAGLYVEAKTTVKNCTFLDNKAESGSCIMAPGATASGLIIYNCRFSGNDVTVRSAGIYFVNLTSAVVRKCVFEDNKVVRGCFYPRTSTGVVIDSCIFRNNVNNISDGFGAGIFSWQCSYKMTNCEFTGNTSGSAVGVYNDNREGGKFIEISKCLFENNTATNYGGCGLQSYRANYTLDSCIFRSNVAPNSAAAIYNSDTLTFLVKNSIFEGNTGSYAAAVANYGVDCKGTFEGCTFKENTATNGGGACSNGFKANVTYKNCTFKANVANFGAAIFTQNDSTRLTVEGCLFTENGAQTNGGCIFQNSGIPVVIKNSTFSANSANIGAALYVEGDSAMVVENSIFTDNLGLEQAAAVFITNGNATFTNCLMARNLNVSGGGAGGALHNNAGGGFTSQAKLVNCTIADNLAPIGAGLAQWEDSDTSSAVMTLQNCLLQNADGKNYGIELGNPSLVSLGGNQSSDEALIGLLTGTKDKNNTSNNFVDKANGDYHLTVGPALDGGVAAGAPAKDLDGNLRQGAPDTGCFELGISGTNQPSLTIIPMDISPNPASEQVMIRLNNAWTGNAVLEVIATDGRAIHAISVEKSTPDWQYTLPVAHLPAGIYRLNLRAEGQLFQAVLVKG